MPHNQLWGAKAVAIGAVYLAPNIGGLFLPRFF